MASLRTRLVTDHRTRSALIALRSITSPWRGTPDYVIAGAQKAGTTALHSYLSQHPQVRPAVVKETRHFDLHPGRGAWHYRAHFPHRAILQQGSLVTGEATPDYLLLPWVPGALASVAPHVKVIVLLRDPVERAYSHFQMAVARGEEHLGFEEALEAEDRRLDGGPGEPGSAVAVRWSRFSYFRRGCYAEQLKRWIDVFGRDRILIVGSRELREDREATLRRVHRFLGIEPVLPPDLAVRNRRDYPPMPEAARLHLRRRYEPHNASLEEILGELPPW